MASKDSILILMTRKLNEAKLPIDELTCVINEIKIWNSSQLLPHQMSMIRQYECHSKAFSHTQDINPDNISNIKLKCIMEWLNISTWYQIKKKKTQLILALLDDNIYFIGVHRAFLEIGRHPFLYLDNDETSQLSKRTRMKQQSWSNVEN